MSTQTTFDSLYLSPHLDDVALSCGGQVYQQTQAGKRVLIATIMAGDPPSPPHAAAQALGTDVSDFARQLHARWQLTANPVAARRAEDLAACAILHAEACHLDMPDCIYRGSGQEFFYQSNAEIFGDIHPQEQSRISELAHKLAALPPATQVFAPLGIGNHVDHQLVRAAAEQVWNFQTLSYYEDYPYAETPGGLARALGTERRSPRHSWCSHTVPLAPDEIHAKCRAIAAFHSQLSSFFTDEEELVRRIHDFTRTRGGERVWIQRP